MVVGPTRQPPPSLDPLPHCQRTTQLLWFWASVGRRTPLPSPAARLALCRTPLPPPRLSVHYTKLPLSISPFSTSAQKLPPTPVTPRVTILLIFPNYFRLRLNHASSASVNKIIIKIKRSLI
jgi:hypothetical protein